MIKSFRCKDTEKLFNRNRVLRFINIERIAQRKLAQLKAAKQLSDLMKSPGNQLEKLIGNRQGQFSIRINVQWRICFIWRDGDAYDVEIIDYH